MQQNLVVCVLDTPQTEEKEGSGLDYASDYRYHQLSELQHHANPSSNVLKVDLVSKPFEDLTIEYISPFFQSLRLEDTSDLTVYLTSFVIDVKRVFRFINLFLQYLGSSIIPSYPTLIMKLVLVEDLIYVPRPYIYENSHKNFFRNSLALTNRYPHIQAINLLSSNEILNRWGEGDSRLVPLPSLTDPAAQEMIWQRIDEEIYFEQMFMQGNAVPRLISIQSRQHPTFGFPIYRHPNDEEPVNTEMCNVTNYLRELVEEYTGVRDLNHVLIQYYRDGRDNIASHSDKTLDIDLNTPIINLSIGSEREMFLQSKQNKNRIEKIPLRHAECVVLGLKTNQFWWHEVPKNVALPSHPVFDKGRVSFTFRRIATFFHPLLNTFVGQGSPFKTIEEATQHQERQLPHPPTDSNEETSSVRTRTDLIIAFSKENRLSDEFRWNEVYGEGFLCK